MTSLAFSSLPLQDNLLKSLDLLGYEQMTPIQSLSLPAILANKDVIGQGKTGSGKTAAFGLGVLNKLDVKYFRVQTLVLCPTRELADQVANELRKLARTIHNIKILTLCGGMPFGPQIGSLEHGAHIIVGTPGRVEEHLNKGTLSFIDLTTLVLDEADRMLDMGFQESVDNIVASTPAERQTLLFSATFPKQIDVMAKNILKNPIIAKVDSTDETKTINQQFYAVSNDEQRLEATRLLLMANQVPSAVIFCNTKRETQQLAEQLTKFGFSVVALHGDLEQRDRDQTLIQFANKSASILVATDVAARGLDIDSLDLVINYHVAHDTEVHVHRIGRTGRAGSQGLACTLFSTSDSFKIALIEDYLQQSITACELPDRAILDTKISNPVMATMQIDGGKKQKLRAGDIVGALTSDGRLSGDNLGKINSYDNWTYIAIKRENAKLAQKILLDGKIKGKTYRVRMIKSL